MKLNITLLRTQAPYWVSLLEFAESVMFRLERMGHEVVFSHTKVPGYRQVLFNVHALLNEPAQIVHVDPDAIIYNIEQLAVCAIGKSEAYYNHLKGHTVWDYAQSNVDLLKARGIDARYVPIGYVPELERYKVRENPENDVVMVGSMNARRRDALQACVDAGMRVYYKFFVAGKERDTPCGNSKIALNVHYYMPAIFEIQRVVYWLANKQFVITENNATQEYFNDADRFGKQPGLIYTPYEKIAETCKTWLQYPKDRKEVAEMGYRLAQTLDVSDYLSAGLK